MVDYNTNKKHLVISLTISQKDAQNPAMKKIFERRFINEGECLNAYGSKGVGLINKENDLTAISENKAPPLLSTPYGI